MTLITVIMQIRIRFRSICPRSSFICLSLHSFDLFSVWGHSSGNLSKVNKMMCSGKIRQLSNRNSMEGKFLRCDLGIELYNWKISDSSPSAQDC